MKRTLIAAPLTPLPQEISPLLAGAVLYDSSSSPEARVYFVDKDDGFYLKIAAKGTLAREAQMTRYFHQKGFGAEVLFYGTEQNHDFFLTRAAHGEDLTHAIYLSEPQRLCDVFATTLRALHETPCAACPVPQRMMDYTALVEANYREGRFDPSIFPENSGFWFPTADEAYATFVMGKAAFRCDVLLHGDYCLPNVIFDGWRFSSFIDLGNGGVGDRHVDLFWGAWTLCYNLKTDAYRDRFFDAYGRDLVDSDLLRTVAAAECFG